MKDDIVIVSAARTPVGAFNGAFANLSAHELGKVAIQESLKRAGVEGKDVSEVILGQILPRAGAEPGPPGLDRRRHPGREPGLGRQPALRLGLRAVALGYQAISTATRRSWSRAARN